MRPLPPHLHNTMLTLTFGCAALVIAAQSAFAQTPPTPQCGPREAVLMTLAERYGEGRRAIGLAGQGHMMEVFSNAETGTWTITATTPQGMMCLIASGGALEWIFEPAPAKGRPA